MHMDVWLRRLALGGEEARCASRRRSSRLIPDGPSVFAALEHEQTLVNAGILAEPMPELARSCLVQANARLSGLGFSFGDLAPKSVVVIGQQYGHLLRLRWYVFPIATN